MTTKHYAIIAILLTSSYALGCARRGEEPKAEATALNVTHWTEKSELYMEYPPLVAGQSALFAVHLTKLDDFNALNAGTHAIEFVPESGGAPTVLRGSPPSRPGAFRVEGKPPAAGKYRWALLIEAPGLVDRHELGTAVVFGDEASAKAEAEKHPGDDPAAIAYLKEQQWTNEFATARVVEAEFRSAIRVPAEIEARSPGAKPSSRRQRPADLSRHHSCPSARRSVPAKRWDASSPDWPMLRITPR